MLSSGVFFAFSAGLFIFYALLARVETNRGQRFFGEGLRSQLDDWGVLFTIKLAKKWQHLVSNTLRLSLYYSIHSALRAILTVLVKAYDRLELVFMRNRERAKQLRAERRALKRDRTVINHLTEIHAHREASALTASEKKRLKAKKLRGD